MLRLVSLCTSRFLQIVNRIVASRITRDTKLTLNRPPLFVIGAPRSGSTALYQAITATLDVAYVNNLTCSLCTCLPLSFGLSRFIFRERAHRCYRSSFGNTRDCGWNAPAECGEFWYRWLPRDRHFVDFDDVSPRTVRHLRSEVARATRIAGKAIVFKNLNAGQRLRLISRSFPEARIVHITRDIRFNAQSIVLARCRNGIPRGTWWSIKPPKYEQYLDLPKADLAIAQVKAIEAQIEQDKQLFSPEQWKTVCYEDLTANPERIVGEIAQFLNVKRRSRGRFREMVCAIRRPDGDRIKVSEQDWAQICRAAQDRGIDKRVERNTVYE